MTEHQTDSVHTGGVAFLLCSMLGTVGGVFGLLAALGDVLEKVGTGERLVLGLSLTIGFVCIGVTIGAIIGMICGSTLSRSFHMVFLAAAGWLIMLVAPVFLEHVRPSLAIETVLRIIGYGGFGIVGLSGVAGWRMARRTTGFTSRARFWSSMGFAAGLLAAPVGYGVWTAKLWSLLQWDWSTDDLFATILIAIPLSTLAGMAGAIYAADRRIAPGFSLLPAQPVNPEQ